VGIRTVISSSERAILRPIGRSADLLLDQGMDAALEALWLLDRGACGQAGRVVAVCQCDRHIIGKEDASPHNYQRAFVEVELLSRIGRGADAGYFGDVLASDWP
jgi:hypothetical protein